MTRTAGFSLIELVVVLLLVAVLLAIAVPGYVHTVEGVHRTMAKLTLMEIAARQERYLQNHKRYGLSLAQLGFGEQLLIDATATATDESRAIYQIALAVEEGEYRGVRAVPLNGQKRDLDCGVLTLHRNGERQVSGRLQANPELCW